ncbi:MAG TPA: STM3941 family protein [Steroidobacteraceae bacterium]|nr:STM3941 family protein [Steroidobacteraceae bacterium]
MALLAFGAGVFVAIGLWLLPREPFVALACIIFFGLCGLVGLVNLLPNSSYLTLTEGGFLFVSLFRKHFVAWSSVQSFVPVKIQFKNMVGWNFSSEYQESKRIRVVNTTVAGVEAALPDTYGMPAGELADLMNQLRDIHTRSVH